MYRLNYLKTNLTIEKLEALLILRKWIIIAQACKLQTASNSQLHFKTYKLYLHLIPRTGLKEDNQELKRMCDVCNNNIQCLLNRKVSSAKPVL